MNGQSNQSNQANFDKKEMALPISKSKNTYDNGNKGTDLGSLGAAAAQLDPTVLGKICAEYLTNEGLPATPEGLNQLTSQENVETRKEPMMGKIKTPSPFGY